MKPKLFLIAILLLSLALRTYRLADFPAGFTPDEASFGYDAYSLLTTGQDQWGQSWPLTFRSFGDFKLPLYGYLTIPSVAIFGLSEFAVRLPSALLGTLAVLFTYLLTKELFPILHPKEKPESSKPKKSPPSSNSLPVADHQLIPLIAAFLLAISPWHISLSRGAFEANLTSFFTPTALYFFLKATNRPPLPSPKSTPPLLSSLLSQTNLWLILAGLFFGLNLYSYHAARLFTPLFLAFLLIQLLSHRRPPIPASFPTPTLMIRIIRVLPLLLTFTSFIIPIFFSFTNQSASRIKDVGIFNPTDNWNAVAQRRWEATQQHLPKQFARIFNNKVTYLFDHFSQNYLSYFSPQFLFTQGAGESTYGMIPGRGVLYWFEFPLLLVALLSIANQLTHPASHKLNQQSLDKNKLPTYLLPLLLIIVWLLLAPIPAALAKGPGLAASRAATMLPAIHILTAYGLIILLKITRKLPIRPIPQNPYPPKPQREQIANHQLALSIFIIGSLVSLSFFLEDYFLHAPRANAPAMSYGWRQVYQKLETTTPSYQEIIISRRFSEPHIFTAFYNQTAAALYQKQTPDWLRYQDQGLPFLDQLGQYQLEKFTFRNLHYPVDKNLKNSLLIGGPQDFPLQVQPLFQVNYPLSQKPAILIVETKQKTINPLP